MQKNITHVAALAGFLVLSACVNLGNGPFLGKRHTPPPMPREMPAAAPAPAERPQRMSVAPKPTQDVTEMRTAVPTTDLTVSVVYFERVLVPEGSALTVTVNGVSVVEKVGLGPPYPATIVLPGDVKYPLTVKARLESLTSQMFTGQVVLNAPPIKDVEILVSPEV